MAIIGNIPYFQTNPFGAQPNDHPIRGARYSGAYYHAPDMTLEQAQIAKMRLVAEKLDLKPGGG